MCERQQKIGPVLLGASGKVGRALQAVWPADTALLCQYRSGPPQDGLIWDMLAAPAPELPTPVSGIIAFAGVTQGTQTDLDTNIQLAHAACDLAKRAGGVRVLLASTQAVYGPSSDVLHEDSPTHPTGGYGRAKLAMERAMAPYPHVTCLRIGNVMGCDALSASMAAGPVGLEQFADATGPARMMIGPTDLAAVLLGLLAHQGPLPLVINVAAAPIVPMQDILQAADAPWSWNPDLHGGLSALTLGLDLLANYVSVPQTDGPSLVAQARAAGWRSARL